MSRSFVRLVLCAILLHGGVASAEVQIGGFAGAYFFPENHLLGRYANSTPGSAFGPVAAGLGIRIHYLPIQRIGGEAEFDFVSTGTRDGQSNVVVAGLHVHALLNLLLGRVRPFIALGAAALLSSPSNPVELATDARPAVEAGIGLKVDIGSWWGLRIDGRSIFMQAIPDTHWTAGIQASLGLEGRFPTPPEMRPIEDGDGDSLSDHLDRCPLDRGPVSNFGCPLPDRDHDGVPDSEDRCPDEVGVVSEQGCPDDQDHDGVRNAVDRCPTVAGLKEYDGCPLPDADHDGVTDDEDRCPNAAGPRASHGCPDTDGDGILDKDDKCPTEKETENGFQDEDGCPDRIPAEIRDLSNVADKVLFRTGAAILLPSSDLRGLVRTLEKYVDLRLEVSGHTDNAGSRVKNLELSRRRAETVRQYLIKHGIAADRLTAVGIGPDRPIADNGTKAGRDTNRRVEFHQLDATTSDGSKP